MRKYLFILVFCVARFPAVAANTASESELRNICLTKSAIYAVPACEQLITTSDADDKIHYRLATLYQKQNQLDKARVTLERALAMFDAKGDTRTVAKTARIKSNVEEEIWLQGKSRTMDEDAELRVKCIKFSKIIPKQALAYCEEYMLAHPDDQEVAQYKIIAQETLSKKSAAKTQVAETAKTEEIPEPSKSAGESVTVASRTLRISGTQPQPALQKPSADLPVPMAKSKPDVVSQAAKAAQPSPKTTPATQPAVAATAPTAQDQVTVDPQVIADIKNELSSLYALLEQQKQNQVSAAATAPTLSYNELGKRYALVIGNADYSATIGKLKNPVNDARDIGEALKKLDFEVQTVLDGNLRSMEEAVDSLAQKIQGDDVVLFYYAGHGVALEGENYLLPTQMGIKDSVDVKYKALNLSFVLDKLDRGSNGVTVVVIDACRNNPFPPSRGAASAGLVQSSGPVGTIIAYSTAPGDVALDGNGRNGLYTKHLLQEIRKPKVKLEDVFKKVRVGVADDTQGAQVPWENSSLKGDFYFRYN